MEKSTIEFLTSETNIAIKSDSLSLTASRRANLRDAVKEYNEETTKATYDELLTTEKPFFEAVKVGYHDVLRIKSDFSEEGEETVSVEPAIAKINLNAFEGYAMGLEQMRQLSNNGQWRYWIEAFTMVLTAKVIGMVGTVAEKARYEKYNKVSAEAKSCDIGATPTSNTQVLAQLQKIIDAILFEDNGKGFNTIKATTKDVNYLTFLMCKEGKGKLSIAAPRNSTILGLVTVIMNRIVNDAEYPVEFESHKK